MLSELSEINFGVKRFCPTFLGNVVRGGTEDRVKLIFRLLERPADKTIKAQEVQKFIHHIVQLVSRSIRSKPDGSEHGKDDDPTCEVLAKSLMHELIMSGETAKNCLTLIYWI